MLERLLALATTAGEPPPGGPALIAKLGKGAAPATAWARLAHALHLDWIKGQEHPSTERQLLFVDTVMLAWQGQGETERLHSGLYPALIRVLGARGDGSSLAALAQRLAPFAETDEAEHALAGLLRQLRQQRRFDALQALLADLRSAWGPPRAWNAPLLAGVLALAREADDFSALHTAAQWLPALLASAEADTATDAPHWRELGKLALRTLHIEAMQRASRALLVDPGLLHAETQPLLLQLLTQLVSFAPGSTTQALLAEAAAQAPRLPSVQFGRARLAHAEGAELSAVNALLAELDPEQPGWAQAMSWWAGVRFHGNDDAGALALYQQLAERHALTPVDRLRMNHLSARDATPEPDGEVSDATPATVTTADTPPPWPTETTAAFSAALVPLKALLEHAPNHDDDTSAEQLVALGDAALAHWRDTLPTLPELSMQDCLRLARHFTQLEAGAFGSHTQWRIAFPFPLGPAYGRIDAERCRALGRALQQHLVALCDFALDRPQALRGLPSQASLRHALELAEWRSHARWGLGEPEAALAEVEALQARLSPMGEAPLRALRARCLLTLGRLNEVAPTLVGTPLQDPADEVLPLTNWPEWHAAEHRSPQTLVDDAALPGHFSAVQPDGRVVRHAHTVAPERFSVLHHTDLRVRNSHLLIGPHGGILRPGAWHLSMGDYPYEHRHVRLRGAGLSAGGAVLRAANWQVVDTPVVVLANMDATYHRNYYHWVLLILSRIDALRARGLLLGGRKLLLPRELSGWMRTSLSAIGITDDQMLLYGADDDLLCRDALVASPIDFASASLVEGLRQTLWRHAGLDPAAPPPADRLLYISRRGEGRRPLVEETRIQAAAEALGFEAVAPETLTLAEQVRLFASARGIAGPPGAAYTNLIWAGAGVRVLSIFKEEANLPTFIDLSIIRGQSHRWLLGRNLPGYALMSIVNAPFSVDLGLAERELAWVAGEGAAE